jgi:hypothetical protein
MATLALVPVLTGVFVLAGPLQSGWARRAGTPVKLLGNQRQASSGSPGAAAPSLTNAAFSGRLSVASGPGSNQRTISIDGRTSAASHVSFVIVLRGTPSGSGVSLTSGTVRIGRAKTASAYSGPVVQLSGNTLVAAVSGQSGQRRATFTLTINGTAVTGTVSLQAGAGE